MSAFVLGALLVYGHWALRLLDRDVPAFAHARRHVTSRVHHYESMAAHQVATNALNELDRALNATE